MSSCFCGIYFAGKGSEHFARCLQCPAHSQVIVLKCFSFIACHTTLTDAKILLKIQHCILLRSGPFLRIIKRIKLYKEKNKPNAQSKEITKFQEMSCQDIGLTLRKGQLEN